MKLNINKAMREVSAKNRGEPISEATLDFADSVSALLEGKVYSYRDLENMSEAHSEVVEATLLLETLISNISGKNPPSYTAISRLRKTLDKRIKRYNSEVKAFLKFNSSQTANLKKILQQVKRLEKKIK